MFKFNQHSCLLSAGVLIFLMAVSIQSVHAQAVTPFAGSKQAANAAQPAEPEAETNAAPENAVAQKNAYLDTYMILQAQIAALKKLVAREHSIVDIMRDYKKMGITYEAPKPDFKTCQQLPKNLSCALAYPDKYSDFLPPPAPLPAVPVVPVAISTDELPQPIIRLSPDSGLKDLMWTDITCLQGVCRAVITPDPTDPAARYSVKAGDALPPGGTVERITYTGVTILHGQSVIQVPPAPTRPFAM